MEAAKAHAGLTAVSLLIGLPLVYWIDPESAAGTAALLAIIVAFTNALGGLARAFFSRGKGA